MRYMSVLGSPTIVTDAGDAFMWSRRSKDWGPTDADWLEGNSDVREYTKGGFKVLLAVLDVPLSSVPTEDFKTTPPASTNDANSGVS